SVGDFRDRGILPEAMVNYLALLGWGPPDGVEVRPVDEIISLFDVVDINQSPAMFDIKKLEAINGDYLRAMPAAAFEQAAGPFVDAAAWGGEVDDASFRAIAPEVQSRVRLLADVPDMIDFLFLDEPDVDPDAWNKVIASNDAAPGLLDAAIA